MKSILFAIAFFFCATSALFAQATLRPGDTVDIRLAGVNVPDETQMFSAQYTVDGQGMVNLPYINNIKAAGLHPSQLQIAIQNALIAGKIYTHPTITVSVAGNGPNSARFVNVGGEVKAPQRIVYTADLTVMNAIIAAGGFTEYANQHKIRWTHGDKVTMLDAAKLRKNPASDPKISPGDNVEVSASIW